MQAMDPYTHTKISLSGKELVTLIGEIKDSCKRADGDLARLRVSYWRLRFIEPAPGVKEMLALVETKIEIELVKNALRDSIAKGETNIELEHRIAKLPENAIKDIEDLRSKLLDEKANQLAMAKEEEVKREKTLRRQQKIDQAIKLRKEEIDTGKNNSAFRQQLSGDPELKSAVDLWESQYRKELADKKASEAKRKLEEIKLAKAEEARKKEEARGKELALAEERRRRIEAEIAEKERIEKENRIQAKLKRYNVKTEVTGHDLHSNPFTYEGQSVVIRLRFDRMTERTMGVFISNGYEILVSNLPTDLFTSAGQVADLIVKVKGTAERILLATPMKIPHVEYIDILQ
jgi:predicted ribosome quality control (RQC) complex YloA/Tae2 family protein